MKKKSNFPLRMDGKTLEKTDIYIMDASENENISAIVSGEKFLNIRLSLSQTIWLNS